CFVVFLEVGPGHRRTPYLEPAEGLAIPRQPAAAIVGDLHLDAERRVPLLLLHVDPRRPTQVSINRLYAAHGSKRAHLGHAPGMHNLDSVDVLECFDDYARAGGAADDYSLQIR